MLFVDPIDKDDFVFGQILYQMVLTKKFITIKYLHVGIFIIFKLFREFLIYIKLEIAHQFL